MSLTEKQIEGFKRMIVSLSERLADEPDYDEYIAPRLQHLINYLKEQQNDTINR
jgi:hypothetical protein